MTGVRRIATGGRILAALLEIAALKFHCRMKSESNWFLANLTVMVRWISQRRDRLSNRRNRASETFPRNRIEQDRQLERFAAYEASS
jgi:hypothetical protein